MPETVLSEPRIDEESTGKSPDDEDDEYEDDDSECGKCTVFPISSTTSISLPGVSADACSIYVLVVS